MYWHLILISSILLKLEHVLLELQNVEQSSLPKTKIWLIHYIHHNYTQTHLHAHTHTLFIHTCTKVKSLTMTRWSHQVHQLSETLWYLCTSEELRTILAHLSARKRAMQYTQGVVVHTYHTPECSSSCAWAHAPYIEKMQRHAQIHGLILQKLAAPVRNSVYANLCTCYTSPEKWKHLTTRLASGNEILNISVFSGVNYCSNLMTIQYRGCKLGYINYKQHSKEWKPTYGYVRTCLLHQPVSRWIWAPLEFRIHD